jgi:hypothetical protein
MPSGPKVTKYTNRHANEAREREEIKKQSAASARSKAEEDAKWADDDRQGGRKSDRAAEKEAKEAEARARKAENARLLEAEAATVTRTGKQEKDEFRAAQREITREAQSLVEARRAGLAKPPSLQNPNRRGGAEDDDDEAIHASTVDAAIRALGKGEIATVDPDARNVGKRARVLYRKFCADNVETVKMLKPNMRRTQYNDMLWDLWQRSPLNPFVQRAEARNKEAADRERTWMEKEGETSDEDEA